MTAAGHGGIPCSFVAGKDLKLAYVGHPLYLDSVIPKVVDGTWEAKEVTAEVDRVKKELAGLNRVVIGALVKLKKTNEAKKAAEGRWRWQQKALLQAVQFDGEDAASRRADAGRFGRPPAPV
jgi:hypothetical protein